MIYSIFTARRNRTICRLGGVCSIQLSYWDTCILADKYSTPKRNGFRSGRKQSIRCFILPVFFRSVKVMCADSPKPVRCKKQKSVCLFDCLFAAGGIYCPVVFRKERSNMPDCVDTWGDLDDLIFDPDDGGPSDR